MLLLMALGSLAVAFWAFGPEDDGLDGFSAAKKVASISVEGKVLEIKPTRSGGNLILKLNSSPLPIFIPSASRSEELLSQLHAGDLIRVLGTISEFNGQEEIVVSSIKDIQILN